MFQSHLTQILAMVTMSIPIAADAESFHREKYAILSALDFTPQVDDFFLGQYAGYQDIPDVRKNSKTETYFAGKLKIDRVHENRDDELNRKAKMRAQTPAPARDS